MMRFLILVLCLLPFAVPAASADISGHVLYVSGEVTVERAGKLYRAVPRAKIREGDTIVTNSVGRAHIRMSDRTLLSLKPNTEFVIEKYRFSKTLESIPTPADDRGKTKTEGSDVSVFSLVKGGFRAITGLIGQRDKNAFGVNTAVATIGIRGTSFVADLEPVEGGSVNQANADWLQLASNDQFASDAPGGPISGSQKLVVGVGFGKVILTNSAGSVLLEHGEFGEVLGAGSAPGRLGRPLVDGEADVGGSRRSQDSDDDEQRRMRMASRRLSQQGDAWTGRDGDVQRPNQEAEMIVVRSEISGPQRNLAIASSLTAFGDHSQALSVANDRLRGDENGHLTGFIAGVDRDDSTIPAIYDLSGGEVVNAGFAPELELSWGRWSGENLELRTAGGEGESFDPDVVGLHYVIGDLQGERFVFPVTGRQEMVLVGNTDPTDSAGHIGFLGRANLTVDFASQQVVSTLDLSVMDQVWRASGDGRMGQLLSNTTPDNVFAGAYDRVSVDGVEGGGGTFSGFVTPGGLGAGLGYALEHSGNLVRGVAAFAAPASN